jgi:hypothetical protein
VALLIALELDIHILQIICARLVLPEEANSNHCISVLSSIGTVLIGLGPGQSIRWAEQGQERSLAVLEVRAADHQQPNSTQDCPHSVGLSAVSASEDETRVGYPDQEGSLSKRRRRCEPHHALQRRA